MKLLQFLIENKESVLFILGVVGTPFFTNLVPKISPKYIGYTVTIALGLYILSL